jgi:hypothetical protein
VPAIHASFGLWRSRRPISVAEIIHDSRHLQMVVTNVLRRKPVVATQRLSK